MTKKDNVAYILNERDRMQKDQKTCPPWTTIKHTTDYLYTKQWIIDHGNKEKVYIILGTQGKICERCNEKWVYDDSQKRWRITRHRAEGDPLRATPFGYVRWRKKEDLIS